jgi:rhodanese-related sulfurtransferase
MTKTMTTITPSELADRRQRGETIDVIDVRTPIEYRTVHCPDARNIPLDRLDPAVVMKDRPTDRPLFVICQSGGRGRKACERLVAAGFANVVNVDGGTGAWIAAGLPVVRGKSVMSLERQVRIGAGVMVVAGVVMGWFVHPGFLVLSAFVGAGLTIAGLTNWCGMGMLLAKMPWNQGSEESCSTGVSA